jgi:hypothetical protein
MIHSVWIVKDTINLFHLDCGCFDIEHDLLTGFFSALSIFAEDTIQRKVNSISIGEFRFIFEKNNDIYFIIKTEKEDNKYLVHKKLTRIQAHFLHDFQDILLTWEADTSIFKPFQKKLEKILANSIEGTKIYCEYCEKLISGKFIKQIILLDEFHFCSELCREHLEKLVKKRISHDHSDF